MSLEQKKRRDDILERVSEWLLSELGGIVADYSLVYWEWKEERDCEVHEKLLSTPEWVSWYPVVFTVRPWARGVQRLVVDITFTSNVIRPIVYFGMCRESFRWMERVKGSLRWRTDTNRLISELEAKDCCPQYIGIDGLVRDLRPYYTDLRDRWRFILTSNEAGGIDVVLSITQEQEKKVYAIHQRWWVDDLLAGLDGYRFFCAVESHRGVASASVQLSD